MRDVSRRLLVWGLGGTVLLPVLLAVIFGLGGLLASLDDRSGAAVCRGIALAVGAMWVVSLAATVLATAVVTLESLGEPRSRAAEPEFAAAESSRIDPRPGVSRSEPS
ncbi:MAG: hypothetical protein RLZZ111_113 [Planctomycetota bacterium]|jgi:hypothetical protein